MVAGSLGFSPKNLNILENIGIARKRKLVINTQRATVKVRMNKDISSEFDIEYLFEMKKARMILKMSIKALVLLEKDLVTSFSIPITLSIILYNIA